MANREFTPPKFYWLLRDFYHDISEFENADAYMESCLKPDLESVSASALKKNSIRKTIAEFFQQRRCQTLIRPVEDEQQLSHIEDLAWESPEIDPDFKHEVTNFLDDLKAGVQVKTAAGKSLNGQMLLGLAMDFAEAVSSDDVPRIESSVGRLVQEEIAIIELEAFDELKESLETELGLEPTTEDNFAEVTARATK